MSFNKTGFILAGTAVAIFGVGFYMWGRGKDADINNYNQYRQVGGSRRHKKRHNKTYKKGR